MTIDEVEVGDQIIGNEKANDHHRITVEGWTGVVREIDEENNMLRIEGAGLHSETWVNADNFEMLSYPEGQRIAQKLKTPPIMARYPFEVGDKIIGLESASEEYDITQEGWEGEVMQVDPESDDDIRVYAEELGSLGLKNGAWVSSKHFKVTKKAKPVTTQPLNPPKSNSMSKMEEAALAFRMATEPMKKHQVKLSMIMEVDALDVNHAKIEAEKRYYNATAGTSVYMPNVVVDEVQAI